MIFRGKTWRYGDDIDTDVIIPARYLNCSDGRELARHCLEDLDASFAVRVNKGDIIVGGRNFGCGSSREHAPLALKESGVSCVVAASFSRIFYRNAINIGLPILESEQAAARIENGALLEVDADLGLITDISSGEQYKAFPFPDFMSGLIQSGGLIGYVQKRMKANV